MKDDSLKDDTNAEQSMPLDRGGGFVDGSRSEPPRSLLTKSQWRIVGNLPCLKKTLAQQKRQFEVVQHVFTDFLTRSNGGRNLAEINQKQLRAAKVNGKRLNADIVAKSIKFLLDNRLIEKGYSYAPGHNSIFYKGGKLTAELMDKDAPIKQERTERIAKHDERYLRMGIDPESRHECRCCGTKHHARAFTIWENGGLSPVCWFCWRDKNEAARATVRFVNQEMKLKDISKKEEEDLVLTVDWLLADMSMPCE
jgi:hypothetical protein